MDTFSCKTYKEILVLKAKERRLQFGLRFSLTKVAAACSIQKTYLSKVLNSEAHLNPDQLSAACEFLSCSEDETEYCLLLRDLATASYPLRRQRLEARVSDLLAKVRTTKQWLEGSLRIQDRADALVYYSDVYLQLVHLYLTIPAYQRDQSAIATTLGLNGARVTALILQLEGLGLALRKGSSWQAAEFNLHLGPEDPAYRAYRSLQRLRSLEKIDKLAPDAPHYDMAASFAADAATYERIKLLILAVVKEAQGQVLKANAEHVYHLSMDLFRWDI